MTLRTTLFPSVPFLLASALAGCSVALPPDATPGEDSGMSQHLDAGSTEGPDQPDVDAHVGTGVDGSTSQDAGTTPLDSGVVVMRDASVPPPPSQGRVVGYYPAWATYDRNFQVSQLPASRMTHVNYAFANLQNGRCVLGDPWADVQKTFAGDTWEDSSNDRAGNFGALRRLKAANPTLRTLISVGGWTWSGQFSDMAKTAAGRETFARSCVDFAVTYGFDGIDIDWEYPAGGGLEGNGASPDDVHNYTLLLAALRDELSARQASLGRSERFLLTIAAPAGPSLIGHLESAAIAAEVDWINVMTYDFHGSWERTTGHNAPLVQGTGDVNTGWNVRAALEAYITAGVPRSQLVMGVPFYGRSWTGVSAGANHGLYASATGVGPGTWEPGVLDYSDIAARYIGRGSFVTYRDTSAEVPYLFDSSSGVFITYDDVTSLRAKRRLVDTMGLGGVMIWDMSSDDAAGTLIDAVRTPAP